MQPACMYPVLSRPLIPALNKSGGEKHKTRRECIGHQRETENTYLLTDDGVRLHVCVFACRVFVLVVPALDRK